jgi:hypothetical protein
MTPSWESLWPVAEPPDGFAVRVLVKSVEQRLKLRRQRKWLLAALVPCLCLGLAFAVGFRQHQVRASRKAQVLEAQRRDTEARLRQLQRDCDIANQRERELEGLLADAKDQAQRSKLRAEVDLTRAELDSTRKATVAGRAVRYRASAAAAKASSAGHCAPGDALCD